MNCKWAGSGTGTSGVEPGAALVTKMAAEAPLDTPFVWLQAKQKKGQSAEWTG